MQTGTQNKAYYKVLLLLCLGYFVDFYDLTIFSANYNHVIRDLFYVHNQLIIQQLYLKITNFYTFGIICGGMFFGIIGDKYGRGLAIRQSILLYSISIFFSIFTHSIFIFSLLRFISGFGLATEFATSSVLISELLQHQKHAKTSISMLYVCGIFGGIIATFIGIFSWQIMFLFGSIAGFILYILRKTFLESPEYLKLPQTLNKGSIRQVINNKNKLYKFIMLLSIIIPFYFTISAMFIFPTFMPISQNLSSLTARLLMCFFLGNLISVCCYNYFLSYLKPFYILMFNTILFAIITSLFIYVTLNTFTFYYLCIGFISGGLPTLWISLVTENYPTHIRNTATNFLYIAGRSSGIIFNLMLSAFIHYPKTPFYLINIISILIITATSIYSLSKFKYSLKQP